MRKILRPHGIFNRQNRLSMYDDEPNSQEDGKPGRFLSSSRKQRRPQGCKRSLER